MLGHTYLPPPQRADSLNLLALDAIGLQDSFDLAAGANCEPLGALSVGGDENTPALTNASTSTV